MQSFLSDPVIDTVERAVGELRRGAVTAVTETESGKSLWVAALEAATLHRLAEGVCQLLLSPERMRIVLPEYTANTPALLTVENTARAAILGGMAGHPLEAALNREEQASLIAGGSLEKAALSLAKVAHLLPALLVLKTEWPESLSVTVDAITDYPRQVNSRIEEVCRAPLSLEEAHHAEVIAYRPPIGGKEHYAIIVGTPQAAATAPLVRIHSSCFTGDLLSSLKCDCKNQLHSALDLMGKSAEGGIILYLMQEGRGIGLTNKLRTYELQSLYGMDTVDANEALGFSDDERLFAPAARMLELLGIKEVRLLTNNPRKASGLEEYGIRVAACVPHVMESTEHNAFYLNTKASRLGHTM